MWPSYVSLPDTSPHPLAAFFFPDNSMFVFAPPRRKPPSPADLRAAMLHAADCLDASLDAQIDGDEAELLRNLETVGGIVAVAIDHLRKPSSEYLSVH
jgi:hypothetical protein